jgi:four helix bundle protein
VGSKKRHMVGHLSWLILRFFRGRFAVLERNRLAARLLLIGMPYQPSPERARTLALHARTFEFACSIIKAYPRRRVLDDPSRVVWRELVKAAGSTTFNLEEADAATGDGDFVAKMRIACREAKEARVAIRLIVRCELEGHESVAKHEDEANQLASIFSAIVRNKKANMKRKR